MCGKLTHRVSCQSRAYLVPVVASNGRRVALVERQAKDGSEWRKWQRRRRQLLACASCSSSQWTWTSMAQVRAPLDGEVEL